MMMRMLLDEMGGELVALWGGVLRWVIKCGMEKGSEGLCSF